MSEHIAYRATSAQFERVANHPSISGKWAKDKGLWEGRQVAVHFLRERGSFHRRTDMRFMYGTLVLGTGNPDTIGVRSADGEVHQIHVHRAKDIYDLTRTKP